MVSKTTSTAFNIKPLYCYLVTFLGLYNNIHTHHNSTPTIIAHCTCICTNLQSILIFNVFILFSSLRLQLFCQSDSPTVSTDKLKLLFEFLNFFLVVFFKVNTKGMGLFMVFTFCLKVFTINLSLWFMGKRQRVKDSGGERERERERERVTCYYLPSFMCLNFPF